MDLKEEEILGPDVGDHWYYVSKGRAMVSLLKGIDTRTVLDVGAGSGVFSRKLIDAGRTEEAVCVDPFYETERVEEHGGRPISFRRRAVDHDASLVLMMDVLEHVSDDRALLGEYCDPLSPGRHVLITVPAFQFVWSDHDVFLEHYRRYTLRQIEDLVGKVGLSVVQGRYFYGTLFPLVAAVRLSQRMVRANQERTPQSQLKRHEAWINACLTAIHDVERVALLPFNRVAGLSVLCLARKT